MEKRKRETAVVVKHTGSRYLVSGLDAWNPIQCVVRGKLRIKGSKTTNPIAVGDYVEFEFYENGDSVITDILPRRNYLIRRSTNLSKETHIIASNIDMAFLITTIDFPEVKTAFIDRFLASCEAYRIPVTIVINKTDLYTNSHLEYLEYFCNLYQSAGYNIIKTSCLAEENIDLIKDLCKNRVSLFSGQSGVGKSSLIQRIDSNLNLKTAEISEYHNQGKHTTTFYQMHPLSFGGFIIDTPGIRGFGLFEMTKDELSHYFREMLPLIDNCKFKPCTHTHEPGCAVKEAVENGKISEERYYSYLSMLEEDGGKYR